MTDAESSLRGGSADEFARIDLVSNHTVFRHQEHYRALLRGDDLPVDTFSGFIHEATHHWCFTSPVGAALSLLYLSVAKKAVRWAFTGDRSEMIEAFDDLCAFEIAVDWLRPLSEGMAQFAEYDILPSEKATFESPPLLAALMHLFNLPRRLENVPSDYRQSVTYALFDDISRWRLSRKTIERKSELLLQPTGVPWSPYLLGYLTVKQLWKNAGQFYDELKEADVFLAFLRKLVFADYALVDKILDRKRRPAVHRGLTFGLGIRDRLEAIREMAFAKDVPWREWKKILAPPSARARSQFQAADAQSFAAADTQKEVQKGIKLYAKYLRELAVPLPFSAAEFTGFTGNKTPNAAIDFFNMIRERHLMWLGDVPAKWVSIGPQLGRIMINGEVFVDNYKLTHISDRGLDELKLDIYISLYDKYQLTTVSNQRGSFGFVVKPKLIKRARSELTQTKLDRRETVRMVGRIREVVRGYVEGTNYQQVLEDFWKTGARDLLDRTYLDYAFDFNRDAESSIAKRGIADILDNDAELVRNVAAISLATSAEMSPEGLLSMSELSLDPVGTIEKVKKLWRIEDFPLADIGKDGFLRSTL